MLMKANIMIDHYYLEGRGVEEKRTSFRPHCTKIVTFAMKGTGCFLKHVFGVQ
jgi:hypothetical protein